VSALEGAAGGLQFRVVSRYHNASTHPNDIRGYLADDSTPPLTYTNANDGRARPADVVSSSFAPWGKARYVAVQDEGESQPHRLVLPPTATILHIQLEDYEAAGLFFIDDLSIMTYDQAGDFAQQILYLRGTTSSDRVFAAFVGMTSSRELLIGGRNDGPAAVFEFARPPRRVRVRVA